ncbi:uncharacterized protein V1513DRAFT_456308 [Lipomyces chichibuensis]|uniref:uncharacterized protein n=1 Tax=Lipomyces chichibuensis TaxID=1546026 RepID=UPI003344003C
MFAPPPGLSQLGGSPSSRSKKSAAKSGICGEGDSGRASITEDTSSATRKRKHGQVAFELPAQQRRPKRMIYEDDAQIMAPNEHHMPRLRETQDVISPEPTGMSYKSPLVPDSEEECAGSEGEPEVEIVESSISEEHDYGGDSTVMDNIVGDGDEQLETQESYAVEEISSAKLMRSRPPTSSSISSEIPQSQPVGTRWQVRWNGRPNYKKFRKSVHGVGANEENSVQRANSGKTYVNFVEYQPENFGIGDEYWSAPRDASPIMTPKQPQTARNTLRNRNTDAKEDSLRFSMSARPDVDVEDDSSVTASCGSSSRTLARQVLANLAGSDDDGDDLVKSDGDYTILDRRGAASKPRSRVTRDIDNDMVFDAVSDRSDSDDDGLKFRFSK